MCPCGEGDSGAAGRRGVSTAPAMRRLRFVGIALGTL